MTTTRHGRPADDSAWHRQSARGRDGPRARARSSSPGCSPSWRQDPLGAVQPPTLDDVFMRYTRPTIRDAEATSSDNSDKTR